jgi:SAM-dependent methyltransferase
MACDIRRRFPNVKVIAGDCQARMDVADGFFDRYIGVHVLEHLPNLPACIREAHRILSKDRGQMRVVIPCEGSPAYSIARKISAERVYNRHLAMFPLPFLPFIFNNLCIGLLLKPRPRPIFRRGGPFA